jgi:RimJ/RimL family protein N-acetyltransferase
VSGPGRPRERIETDRLVLERAGPEHADDVFAGYAADPEVTRWLLWTPHESLDETRNFLVGRTRAWEEGEEFGWAIRERGTGGATNGGAAGTEAAASGGIAAPEPSGGRAGPVIGMIGLRPGRELDHLGFVLARDRWGRGYATEALRRVLREATGRVGLPEVRASVHPGNRASMRVLKKAGMRRTGYAARHHVFPNLGPEPVGCYSYVFRPDDA